MSACGENFRIYMLHGSEKTTMAGGPDVIPERRIIVKRAVEVVVVA